MEGSYNEQKSKEQEKVQSQRESQSNQSTDSQLFFHSILCIPRLLDNPANTEHSFMHNIFTNRRIKKVRRTKDFLSVDIVEKKDTKTINVMENYSFKNSQLQNQLTKSYQSISTLFQNQKGGETEIIQEDNYYKWLDQVKDKNIIVWFCPYSENGPKLRSFSISASLLKILDYKIDELALDIQHFGAQSLDVVDGHVYKATFLMMVNAVRKFKEMKLYGGFTTEDILKQGQSIVVNELKGKGNKKVTVETKIFMVSQSITCHEILKVLDHKQIGDNERRLNRESALVKAEQIAFNSLSTVAKLPRAIDPSNSSKICGYIEIKPQRGSNRNEKTQPKEKKIQHQNQ